MPLAVAIVPWDSKLTPMNLIQKRLNLNQSDLVTCHFHMLRVTSTVTELIFSLQDWDTDILRDLFATPGRSQTVANPWHR